MPKLKMLSGLPGSGKSSHAEKIVGQGGWIRLNRDLLRTMLHFNKFSGLNEDKTTEAEIALAKQFLSKDVNVVIDDCNLNPKNVTMWSSVAVDSGAKFEKDFIDTPWQECVRRDNLREKFVGAQVIKNMALQYGLITFDKDSVVLCDIDGTIANCEHRQHYVNGEEKDWEGFFSEMYHDGVRTEVQRELIELYNQGKAIIFVTARPEDYKEDTLAWLRDNYLSFGFTVLMRRTGDTRPDTVVKKQMLDTYFKDKSVIHKVIDDRPSVIRMWRENGLVVEDVGKGIEF